MMAATAAILKLFWAGRPIDSKHGRKYQGDLQIKNSENLSDLKSKTATMAAILKIYFELLLLNQKDNWIET